MRTTMSWPANPAPAKPDTGYFRFKVFGTGAALALILCIGLGTQYDANEKEATAREASRTARALGSFPVSNRVSLESCGRRGVAIAACLESEEALRTKAEALWLSAPLDSRKSCLDASNGAEEPVGKLYVCLALLK